MPAKKDAPGRLAEKLVQALREQKQRGERYPLPLKQLAELADPHADARTVLRAVSPRRKAFSQHALVARLDLQAPVALASDLPVLADSPLLLSFLLETARSATNQALSLAKLKDKAASKLQKVFQEAVNRRIADESLPPGVGWIWMNRSRNLFLNKDLHLGRDSHGPGKQESVSREEVAEAEPGPPREAGAGSAAAIPVPVSGATGEMTAQETGSPLPEALAAAFHQLDRQAGGHNFVNLVDLRRALPWDRATFDAELRRLRIAGQFTLSAAEGRHGISPAEQDAGILEDGALLLYVSRRAP